MVGLSSRKRSKSGSNAALRSWAALEGRPTVVMMHQLLDDMSGVKKLMVPFPVPPPDTLTLTLTHTHKHTVELLTQEMPTQGKTHQEVLQLR